MKIFQMPFVLGKLTPEARNVVVATALMNFGVGLGSFFLNIFLWRQAQDLSIVIQFNLIHMTMILVGYLVAGGLWRYLKLRGLMQLGFLLFAVTYGLLVFLQERAIQFVPLLAVIYGLAIGFYWTGTHNFIYLATKDKTRDGYYAANATLSSLFAVLVPLISGGILALSLSAVTLANYYILFFLAILVLLTGLVFCSCLPDSRLPQLQFRELHRPWSQPTWRWASLAIFTDGFKIGAEGVVVAILSYQILQHEFEMGLLSATVALLSAYVAIRLGSFLHRGNRIQLGLLGAVMLGLAAIAYVSFFSIEGVILSSALTLFAGPLFGVGLAATFFDAVDRTKTYPGEQFKFLTFREISLTAGRVMGAGTPLLFLNWGSNIMVAKFWYLVLGLLPLAYWYLTQKFIKTVDPTSSTSNLSLFDRRVAAHIFLPVVDTMKKSWFWVSQSGFSPITIIVAVAVIVAIVIALGQISSKPTVTTKTSTSSATVSANLTDSVFESKELGVRFKLTPGLKRQGLTFIWERQADRLVERFSTKDITALDSGCDVSAKAPFVIERREGKYSGVTDVIPDKVKEFNGFYLLATTYPSKISSCTASSKESALSDLVKADDFLTSFDSAESL